MSLEMFSYLNEPVNGSRATSENILSLHPFRLSMKVVCVIPAVALL